jgi:hypothetical protein
MYNPDKFDFANDQMWLAMNEFNSISGVINNNFPVRITRQGIEPDTRKYDAMIYRLNAAELDREFKIEQKLHKNKEHMRGAPNGKGFLKIVRHYYTKLRRVLASD